MHLPSQIPSDSILGINSNGMHDSAIALLSAEGRILFASSLERLSRVKQDGRPPAPLLAGLDWSKISGIAVSTNEKLIGQPLQPSATHPIALAPNTKPYLPHHEPEFQAFLNTLPAPKHYFGHHLSHLASAYFISGFQESMSLVYDAGTYNDFLFGGLYHCRGSDIRTLDVFNTNNCPKFTLLYAFVTALLGFSPNKHEGKITGLASYGRPTQRCRDFLGSLLNERYFDMAICFEWVYRYSDQIAPIFITPSYYIDPLRAQAATFSREELAATVQAMAEEHILQILDTAKVKGLITCDSICLSGGLFANVKINQRVKEWGFRNVFVAPAMTDDGTALGAALLLCAQKGGLQEPYRLPHMFHGIRSTAQLARSTLKQFDLVYTQPAQPAQEIARALHQGLSVAVVQGACEFGPRALGHRSVLAAATHPEINQILNKKFHRTEFMPFAPMTLWEDAQQCYENITGAEHTAEFMTMTFNCTEHLKQLCPAVVHVDGTARPQLIRADVHPFIHSVITHYKALSGRPAIINTSYNMHEEPIIGNAADAIKGFLESGIDWLFIEGYLVKRTDNYPQAAQYLQSQVSAPTQKEQRATALYQLFERRATPSWVLEKQRNYSPPNPPAKKVSKLKKFFRKLAGKK